MGPADSVLLRAWIVHRDAEAFAQIVRRYAGLVYGSALRVLGRSADAEDVSQECFLALAGAEGAGPDSLAAWLHAVATRQALKRVRGDRARHRRELAQAEGALERVDADWDDIESYVDEAIEELPEDLRYAVTAHFLLQRTHRAIARELGVSRQAVSYRIGKGVEEIRRALKGRGISAPVAVLGSLLGAHAHGEAPAELSASLGKLAIAGTPARGEALVHASSALRSSLLKWSALALVALAVVGTGIVMSRREEAPATTSPVLPTVSPPTPAETVASFAEVVVPEAPPAGPEARPVFVAEPVEVEEAIEERDYDGVVSGRVFDRDTGMPLADATVLAEYTGKRRFPSGMTVTTTHVREGETDSMGGFEILGLASRKYTLRANVRLRDFKSDEPKADLRSRYVIRGVEIGVSLNPDKWAAIEGLVTSGGEYLQDQSIQVKYDPVQSDGTILLQRGGSMQGKTGENGEYSIEQLPEGTAAVTLGLTVVGGHITQFVGTELEDELTAPSGINLSSWTNSGWMTQFVDLEPGETYVIDFDIPVSSDGVIYGSINPPPWGEGALVRAYTDNRDGVSVRWTARPSPSGLYWFAGLPAGEFEVTVEPANNPRGIRIVTAEDGSVDLTTVWIEQGMTLSSSGNLRSIGGEEIIRLSSGMWTRSSGEFADSVMASAPGGWTLPPRQYYASYEDAMAELAADYELDGDYGSKFVTLEPGIVARLDFDFDGDDGL